MAGDDKTVIIGGGLGPMAGVYFHKKIIESTNCDQGDQEQLDVLHVSRSRHVTERMAFLAGHSIASPAVGMCQSVKLLAEGLKESNCDAVISIPCNTFHAPAIFDHFLELLQEEHIHYEVLNIISETVDSVGKSELNPKRVGVLGTIGTREHRVFHTAFENEDVEVIDIPLHLQNDVRDLILNIKKVNKIFPEHIDTLRSFFSVLHKNGADGVILGCTELSMIVDEPITSDIPYIDPMTILARATVEKCGGPGRLAKSVDPTWV